MREFSDFFHAVASDAKGADARASPADMTPDLTQEVGNRGLAISSSDGSDSGGLPAGEVGGELA